MHISQKRKHRGELDIASDFKYIFFCNKRTNI